MYLLWIRIKAFLIRIIQTRRKYPFETCRADIQNKGQRKKEILSILVPLSYWIPWNITQRTQSVSFTHFCICFQTHFRENIFVSLTTCINLAIIVKSFYKKIYCIICLKYNTSEKRHLYRWMIFIFDLHVLTNLIQ